MIHMMWWPYSLGWGGWIVGLIIMVIFWGGLIALIVWGIRRLTEHSQPAHKQDPLDIAKDRYARGEITREQFEQIKKDLQS
jgi:putative membrane protein